MWQGASTELLLLMVLVHIVLLSELVRDVFPFLSTEQFVLYVILMVLAIFCALRKCTWFADISISWDRKKKKCGGVCIDPWAATVYPSPFPFPALKLHYRSCGFCLLLAHFFSFYSHFTFSLWLLNFLWFSFQLSPLLRALFASSDYHIYTDISIYLSIFIYR